LTVGNGWPLLPSHIGNENPACKFQEDTESRPWASLETVTRPIPEGETLVERTAITKLLEIDAVRTVRAKSPDFSYDNSQSMTIVGRRRFGNELKKKAREIFPRRRFEKSVSPGRASAGLSGDRRAEVPGRSGHDRRSETTSNINLGTKSPRRDFTAARSLRTLAPC
jgi:hypothetical protein